jgi:pyroglutamyl-peptidase
MNYKILVTSFEPFDQRGENQSFEVASLLKGVEHLSLPVVFEKAAVKLSQYLKNHSFDCILCLGEAPIQSIHLEHVALNMMHGRIADNEGFQPQNQRIDKDGKDLYYSSLPLEGFARILQQHQLPFQDSYHAGTYVCNDLFYRLMKLEIVSNRGFIHVPSDPLKKQISLQGLQVLVDALNKGTLS